MQNQLYSFLCIIFIFQISFRQAERKLKEMELESAQLRNKLTMVDKKLENGASKLNFFQTRYYNFKKG